MRFRFQFRRYRLPFRVVVRTAHGAWSEREGVIIRLEDASAGVGFGEAAPIRWFGTESVDEIETVCREFGEWVEAETLDAVPQKLGCLRHALAMARDEIKRRATTLQPEKTQLPDLAVAALLPAGQAALTEVLPKIDAGFRVFKWKVGVSDPDKELGL